MKKKFTYIAVATLLVTGIATFASCQKSEDGSEQQADRNVNPLKTLPISQQQQDSIAKRMTAFLANNPSICKDLHAAIQLVNSYGVDEFLYAYDILYPQYSVFLPDTMDVSSLQYMLSRTSLLDSCGVSNMSFCGNLQFYWPYHQNWDHVTPPAVIFEHVYTGSVNLTCFIFDTITECINSTHVSPRNIDEDKRPYIIIREANYPYYVFPDFKHGEYYKNGTLWCRMPSVYGEDGQLCFVDERTGKDTIIDASSYLFVSKGKQYDLFVGSQFVISMARVRANGTVDTTCRYRIDLTRNEIKNHTPIPIDLKIHPDWKKSCGDVYYYLREEDWGGSNISLNAELSLGDGNKVSVSLQAKSSDTHIASDFLSRDEFFNKCEEGENTYLWGGEKLYMKTRLYSSSTL